MANEVNQGAPGSVASINVSFVPFLLRLLLFLFYSLLVAEPVVYFTNSGIQVSNAVARQIYSGVQGAQAISDTFWSIPCNSTFPITLTFAGIPSMSAILLFSNPKGLAPVW